MKKILAASLLLPFLAFKCKKSGQDTFLEGRVVRITCADFVVQVLNNDNIGDDSWNDVTINNNIAIDNVFVVSNACTLSSDIKKVGNIVRFKIDQSGKNNCVVCMIYDAPPKTAYDIKEVSLVQGK